MSFKNVLHVYRKIGKFATQQMKTTDVRIDGKLNKFVWSNGVRNVLTRVRVRLSRHRNLNIFF